MITEIPEAARRVMALHNTLSFLGFDQSEAFIVPATDLKLGDKPRMWPPMGQLFLTAGIMRNGVAELVITASTVDRTWYEAGGRDRMLAEWNALSQTERNREWKTWVPDHSLLILAGKIRRAGIAIPRQSTGLFGGVPHASA